VKFTNRLFETLKFSPTNTEDLINIFTEMDSLKTEWTRKIMRDNLTPDALFTALLLRSLPTNRHGWNVQQQIIREVTSYVKTLEKDGAESTALSEHPIYDYTKKQIEDYNENTTFNQPKKKSATIAVTTRSTPYVAKSGYGSSNQKREQAAEAEEADSAADGQKLFTGEVTDRKTIITLPASGDKKEKTVPYYAVRKLSTLCSKCFNPDNSRNEASNCDYARRHYATQCTKCQMFGHHTANCLQKK